MEKFNVTCRTCNTERSNLLHLSAPGSFNADLKLSDLLASVCPALPCVNDELFPQNICLFCSKQLEIAYKFQLQCMKSYQALWSRLNEQHLVIKSEETEKSDVENNVEYTVFGTEDLEMLEDDDDNPIHSEEYESSQQSAEVDQPPSPKAEAPHICCHCDKKFLTSSGLQLHEKLTHKNLKPILVKAEILTIECKFCHQVFETTSQLRTHCRLNHKEELAKEFTCNVCQKKFPGRNRYKHHLLYHGKCRYMCTVKDCNRAFIIRYKLLDHLRRYHGINLSPAEAKSLIPAIVDDDAFE